MRTITKTIYRQLTDDLGKCLAAAMTDFVAIGYYLRVIRDEKLYQVDGYENVYDYAKEKYNLSVSSVSRFIAINTKFSDPADPKTLNSKYAAMKIGASKLSEMLTMTDEEIEQVTAETTVKELREIKAKRKAKEADLNDPISRLNATIRKAKESKICDVAKEEPQPEPEAANKANPETLVNTGLPESPRATKNAKKVIPELPAVPKKPKGKPEPSDEEIAAFCCLEGITEKTSIDPGYLKEVWGFGITTVTNEFISSVVKSWEGSKNGLKINGKSIMWERLSERLKEYFSRQSEPQPEICDVAKTEETDVLEGHIDYSLKDVKTVRDSQAEIWKQALELNCSHEKFAKKEQILHDALELLYQSLQKTPLAEEEK